MGGDSWDIIFDSGKCAPRRHHEHVYAPGDTLRGYVAIELAEQLRLGEMVMRVRGKATTFWAVGAST